ncbi:hypothetical protein FHS27_006442 [Rhodopirellula rubra]|uniref:Transmembrane protein n=1 Tax=Aporhodopirellula rubra TaxID=980271 RepID=A0A7W5H9N1_9BACT|nr:hypothetical protein [Aporhodopirellula rubra]MBB3210594.1 hypothetical protein [Aporhodopirellula rubra]
MNLSKRFRLVVAALLVVLWAGWAYWSNIPHYYDVQAMEQELAELLPAGAEPKLAPAVGGFPVDYIRYDFSQDDRLTIQESSTDKLGLNVLLCALATMAVGVLALRATASRSSFTIAFCLFLPTCLAYALFGRDQIVVAYVYFLPLAVFAGAFLVGLVRNK